MLIVIMWAGVLHQDTASAGLQIQEKSTNCMLIAEGWTRRVEMQTLTFPNHCNTSSLDRVMVKWIPSTCLQEGNCPEEDQNIWSKRRQGFQPCYEAGIGEPTLYHTSDIHSISQH